MTMNHKMVALMQRLGVHWPLKPDGNTSRVPKLNVFEGSVLLQNEYERNRHVKTSDSHDRTGFECFINHVHLPFTGTTESLISCLQYAGLLEHALVPFGKDRKFRVIVAISEDDRSSANLGCTIRFHQLRPGEDWVADDLERYESEAILVFDVPS